MGSIVHEQTTLTEQEALPSCREAVSEIVGSFRDRDIRNFLFTSDAIDAPYFKGGDFSKSAITVKFSSKRCYDGVEEGVEGYMVYKIAFNIGNRTLGFGFHDHGARGMYCSRFVNDDSAGTFTTVLRGGGRVVITYKKYLSTTRHKRFSACFDDVVGGVEWGCVESVLAGLKQVLVCVEFRKCCYCGSVGCSCCTVLTKAKHPFDDTVFRRCVKSLIGSYAGFARVECYDKGCVSTRNAECYVVVNETDDESVCERLRRVASGETEVWRGVYGDVVEELKTLLRRERNRVAARKSNLKKKLLNDGLKAAVSSERRRVEGLRSRELDLRRQNLELRRLLALRGREFEGV